jgi:hypothetical protein
VNKVMKNLFLGIICDLHNGGYIFPENVRTRRRNVPEGGTKVSETSSP